MSAKPFPWRTLAVIAVALNLALAGILVGAGASHFRPRPPGAETRVGGGLALREALADLPGPQRAAVRRVLARSFMDARPLRRAAREARENLGKTILAEPFDPVAVDAAFARVRAADAAVQARLHQGLIDALDGLSAEDRTAMVKVFNRRGGARPALGPAPEMGAGPDAPPAAPSPEGPLP